jgi:hypothetical protein
MLTNENKNDIFSWIAKYMIEHDLRPDEMIYYIGTICGKKYGEMCPSCNSKNIKAAEEQDCAKFGIEYECQDCENLF